MRFHLNLLRFGQHLALTAAVSALAAAAGPRRTIGTLLAVLAIYACPLASPAFAEDDDNAVCLNKSQYTLFNPTPAECMREFEPDRPDLTDNPFTVDAGHIQLEADLVNYARSRPDEEGTVTEKFLFGSTDIRIGLTNRTEVDFLVQPINAVRTQFDGASDDWAAGPDTLEIGFRYNIYGNDTFEKSSRTALGIRPFIEVPTVRNGVGEEDVEGGISVMFAAKLADRIEVELMTEYDFAKNEEGSGYHVEYFNSGNVAYQWTSKLATYVEVATLFGNDEGPSGVVQLGVGVLYQPRENVQIDFGSNFGVTDASDRINPWIGWTRRF